MGWFSWLPKLVKKMSEFVHGDGIGVKNNLQTWLFLPRLIRITATNICGFDTQRYLRCGVASCISAFHGRRNVTNKKRYIFSQNIEVSNYPSSENPQIPLVPGCPMLTC